MFQSNMDLTQSPFKKLAFSDKVWRCLERSEQGCPKLEPARPEDVVEVMALAREQLSLSDDAAVLALLRHNPGVIRIARAQGRAQGMLAILPLNADGMDALVHGTFSGRNPDPRWVCRPGERPEALYVWLVYLPGSFGRMLAAIAPSIDALTVTPCPMFSRPATAHSARLHKAAGFMQARDYYPACMPELQVVFPEQALHQAQRGTISVRIARTFEEMMQVFSVRSATYIAEQYCLYEEEFDGNDFCATQYLGLIDGDAAGCLRLRFFNGFAKLERLAVRREYRNSRLAYKLVREALEHCRRKGYTRIYGHSRLDLVRFWRVFGFRPIETRPEFCFANVRYAEILAELEPHPDAVTLDASPMMLIRPEGAWDRPGPFDLSLSDADPRRKALMAQSTRTIQNQAIVA